MLKALNKGASCTPQTDRINGIKVHQRRTIWKSSTQAFVSEVEFSGVFRPSRLGEEHVGDHSKVAALAGYT